MKARVFLASALFASWGLLRLAGAFFAFRGKGVPAVKGKGVPRINGK